MSLVVTLKQNVSMNVSRRTVRLALGDRGPQGPAGPPGPGGGGSHGASVILWVPSGSLTPAPGEEVFMVWYWPDAPAVNGLAPGWFPTLSWTLPPVWVVDPDDYVLVLLGEDQWPSVYAQVTPTGFVPVTLNGGDFVSASCDTFGYPSGWIGQNSGNPLTGGTLVTDPATEFVPQTMASEQVTLSYGYDNNLSGLSNAAEAFTFLDDYQGESWVVNYIGAFGPFYDIAVPAGVFGPLPWGPDYFLYQLPHGPYTSMQAAPGTKIACADYRDAMGGDVPTNERIWTLTGGVWVIDTVQPLPGQPIVLADWTVYGQWILGITMVLTGDGRMEEINLQHNRATFAHTTGLVFADSDGFDGNIGGAPVGTVFVDATTNPVTRTLDNDAYPGREVVYVKTDASANTVTVEAYTGQSILGPSDPVVLSAQWEIARFVFDGTDWVTVTTAGPAGAPGAAATVDAGTASTVPFGDPPTVTNAGTTSAAIFDFGIPQGEQGVPGDPGAPGAAATADAGTTSTLAPGSPATVTNSGSTSAAVFDFGVPEGLKGDQGDPGPPGPGVDVSAATHEPLGHADRAESSVSFDNGSRTYTIAPVAATYEVWCAGTKYDLTSQSVTIPNTTGLYYIYFDTLGVLQYKTTYFDWATETPTAYVYWNQGTGKAEFFADERHGIVLDWATHEYLHRTRGAAMASGFSLSGYTISGTGGSDTDAQASLSSGTFFDEDLQVDVVATATPTPNTWEQDLIFPMKVPVFYLDGTAWRADAPTNFPLKTGTIRARYNLLTGSSWSTADAGQSDYVVSWLVATNNLTYPVMVVLGQASYGSLPSARNALWEGLTLTNFPVFEFRPLYKLIFQTATSYANTPHARLRDVQDIRGSISIGSGTTTSDHGLLNGLADDDHLQYALADGSRGSFDALGDAATVQTNLTTHTGLTTTAHGGIVPSTRSISAGTGLTGGGDLSANRTLAVSLAASDIPSLDVAKITTGVFASARSGRPIGVTGAQLTGGATGGHPLIPAAASAAQAVTTGSMFLGQTDRSGLLNLIAVWVTSTSLTAGQQIYVVAYNASTTTGLPTTQAFAQAIVAASTNLVSVGSLSLTVPAGAWIGVHNPSTNAGSITITGAQPITGGLFVGGLSRFGLTATSQGTTPSADVSAYTYSTSASSSVFATQQTVPQIIGRLT